MSKMPTLDVIILTYNRAKLFEQSLRSVCNQTYQDFTVKVLNNGSTDNTEDVFNKVKSEYPFRKFDYLKFQENHLDQYFVDKKNEFITADYVIVFHDDDLMHPHYIEHLMKIIPKHPEFVLLAGKTRVSEHPENLEWEKPSGKFIVGNMRDIVKWYFKGDSFSFPAICYKSYWYKNTKFRNDLYGNRGDFPFVMDIAEHGKVCRLEDRFLHYRLHTGQDTFHFPSEEKKKNLIKKMADVLLSGNKECQTVFYNGIKNIFIPSGYIDYKTAFEEGWIQWSKINYRNSYKKYVIYWLKYILYSIFSLFSSKCRKKARKYFLKSKNHIKIDVDKCNEIRIKNDSFLDINVHVRGKNNKIIVCSADGVGQMNIDVIGNNNTIFIEKIKTNGKITINTYCSDSRIDIHHLAAIQELTIINGYKEHYEKITGGRILIGKNTILGEAFIFNPHSNSHINIGENCMFSEGISIRNTDGHPIYDAETKECLNKIQYGNGIDIGDHVWIGLNATILKNAKIPDNTIIGTQAVVTKQFSEQGSIIAGNPAKIIKHNIIWTARNDDFFSPIRNTKQ